MSIFKTLDATQISYRERKRVKIVGQYALGRVLGEGPHSSPPPSPLSAIYVLFVYIFILIPLGSYGKVKEGLHVESLNRVAVKIFSPSRLSSVPGASSLVKREIALMRLLKCASSCIIYCRSCAKRSS